MDFLDNVVKSSNAILQSSKEKLNNPFGNKQQQQQHQQPNPESTNEPPQPSTSQATNTQTSETTSKAAQRPSTDDSTPPSTARTGSDGSQAAGLGSQFANMAADAEIVTQKAVKGAKDIGNFLFSMANKAGQTVTQTAKQVKQVVENTNILTDFTKEQQDFIKEHGVNVQAAQPPWCSYPDDEAKMNELRDQILTLSQDRRNFVRSPPNNSNFNFDPQQCYPVALSLLKEDPNLGKMRFELVPKLISEDSFWRNYFYRVHVLKQMLDGNSNKAQGWSSSRSSSGEGPDEDLTLADDAPSSQDITADSSRDKSKKSGPNPFESTTASATNVNLSTQDFESEQSAKLIAEADDLKSKLRELNIGFDDEPGQDENDEEWEEELQKDLQEFELVSGDIGTLEDEEVLDKYIMELQKSAGKNQ